MNALDADYDAAKGDDVRAPIRELFEDLGDLGGAANVSHSVFVRVHDHKGLVVLLAPRDHVLVALFKDVEGHGFAWDEGEFE